jgi:1-aminocyclopropane-1-carboxylate deaminase/D-cysteine desulfhydrase-like pyridoxal-dependent ACC family enzyme
MIDDERLRRLKNGIGLYTDNRFQLHSRVTALRMPLPLNVQAWVKRDDDLGFAYGGTKLRKFASLLPWLQREGFRRVGVVGGAYANNVLGFVQLAREFGLEPTAFLRGEPSLKPVGNLQLLRLLLPEESIRWVSRSDWPQVHELATQWAEAQRTLGVRTFLLPEGSATPAALPGLATLVVDVLRNEQELGQPLHHVWVEVGTGLTYHVLSMLLQWLGHPAVVQGVQLAADEAVAASQWFWAERLAHWLGLESPLPLPSLQLYPMLPSFRPPNNPDWDIIREMAQATGILLDPIYGARLWRHVLPLLQHGDLPGNHLVLHSGGLTSLLGYEPSA